MSRFPGPQNLDRSLGLVPPRTPGPLGVNDAADPSAHAHPGDTPGPLGVNDGAARLAGPAMPTARMDTPEMALVRITREQLEAAKRECKVKADTAARYWKAWEDSRQRLGPAGDPKLARTADTEMRLYERQVSALVKPATIAYADAIEKAVRAGCISLAGSFSAEEILKRLLDVEETGQLIVNQDHPMISRSDWSKVLDKLADYVLPICAVDKDPRGIKLAFMILQVAELFGVDESAPTGKPSGIRRLREFVAAMHSDAGAASSS